MAKNILIISTSPRRGGNSDTLADAFYKGASEAGHSVEKICLYDKTIGFCRGCLSCQNTQKCIIDDDASVIVKKMLTADVIVFATPVYYYEMSGQMKTLLDRSNPLYPSDYAFREIYLLASAAEDAPETADGAERGLKGWISCFERASFVKRIFAGGVNDVGDISGHPAVAEAYEAGKAV